MSCQGRKLRGSGHTKTATVADRTLNDKMQQLLAAREAQDIRYFPSTGAQERVTTVPYAFDTVVPSAYAFDTTVPSAYALPVEPNPPPPLSVPGPGSASTTTTSTHGRKSGAAS